MKYINLLITFHLWKRAECLTYKLKTTGVSDNLLTLFQSFLDNRYQRVLLIVKTLTRN